jgi:hypothetical protein
VSFTAPSSGSATRSFELRVDAGACAAQGYAQTVTSLLSEDFEPVPGATVEADGTTAAPIASPDPALAGITAGCGTAPLRYCPGGNVSRGQMAVFVTRTFDLPVSP